MSHSFVFSEQGFGRRVGQTLGVLVEPQWSMVLTHLRYSWSWLSRVWVHRLSSRGSCVNVSRTN